MTTPSQWISPRVDAQVQALCRSLLAARDFAGPLQRTDVLRAIRTQCWICGLTMKPGLLCWHLRTKHQLSSDAIQPFVYQLFKHMKTHRSQPHKCFACEQVIHLPDAEMDSGETLQQVEIHMWTNCPVALTLSILLGFPNGSPDSHRMDERSSRGGSHIRSDGPPLHGPTRSSTHVQKRPRQDGCEPNPMPDLVQQMLRMLLRHDQDLSLYRQETTFIVFCSKGQHGVLQLLLKQTQAWQSQRALITTPIPLRSHLIRELFQTC